MVNVVPGLGPAAGAALASHMGLDKMAFTGSDITGRKIIDASKGNIKRLMLELGGRSPDIVYGDADLDAAVAGAGMAYSATQVRFAARARVSWSRAIYY